MTEKDLRRLSKTEMLAIIRDQEFEITQLKAEVLKSQNELTSIGTQLEECGSIAEAALQLNGVFQAAQLAADQYLNNIRNRESGIDEHIRVMEQEANSRIQERLRNTEERCRAMEAESQQRAASYWTQLRLLLDQYYQSHEGLVTMLNAANIKITIPVLGAPLQSNASRETEEGLRCEEAGLGTTYVRTAGFRA